MAQVLDSGPAASSALGQPDKNDNTGPRVWSEARLSPDLCPYAHDVPLTHLQQAKPTLHGKDVNK